MKKNILIRGHVRNSFREEGLVKLLRSLCLEFKCDIYMHAWDVVQTSRSWRSLEDDNTVVDQEFIRRGMLDVWENVKGLIIEDEMSVSLLGDVEKINNSSIRKNVLLAMKSMFYGKLRLTEHVSGVVEPDDMVFLTRFDVLSNSNSLRHDEVLDFISNPPVKDERITFLRKQNLSPNGIDNIYCGRAEDMFGFVRHFYTNFDEIYSRHNGTGYQEHVVFCERNNF